MEPTEPTTEIPEAGRQPAADSASERALPEGVKASSPGMRLLSWLLDGLLAAVTLGIGWLIWAAIIVSTGQTPAKKLLGMRVIKANTLQPATFATMFFLRGLIAGFIASVAITITLGILLFMPFWDKRRQNLWDKISGTYVVSDPNDAWGTKPDLRNRDL